MPKIKAWINAARLRTLPLSVSGILVGSGLAAKHGFLDTPILIFALLTTIAFQITSNFANDYGDGVKGTDNASRIGPKRAYQAGLLSRNELKRGITLSALLSFGFALALLFMAFGSEHYEYFLMFAALGLLSIWASIRYTVGEKAYGYRGLGDLSVFIFFGLLSVLGTMFLYTKFLDFWALLPATTIGLLSTSVLNLNNLRDYESDKEAGKNTLVVKMGFIRGKRYHFFLIFTAFLCMSTFLWYQYDDKIDAICLLAFLPIFAHLNRMNKFKNPILLDPELKKVALSTFLLALLFYIVFNNFL